MKTGINLSGGEVCKAKNNVLDVGRILDIYNWSGKRKKKWKGVCFLFSVFVVGGGGWVGNGKDGRVANERRGREDRGFMATTKDWLLWLVTLSYFLTSTVSSIPHLNISFWHSYQEVDPLDDTLVKRRGRQTLIGVLGLTDCLFPCTTALCY